VSSSSAYVDAAAGLRDAVGRAHLPCRGTPRIVSLVPSLTELICDLGLDDCLVGRTGFCVRPRETLKAVPKVGGTKDVKLEAVRALRPTHVVVNIDENRRETVDELATFVPHVVVTHPLRPGDNHELYRLLGHVFGRPAQAQALAESFAAAESELAHAAGVLPREKVLYLIWKKPWMTISPATYISATLAAAGWDSLPARSQERYPVVEGSEPWLSEVDRVLLPSEPYRFRERHLGEVSALPAVAGKPVQLIDGQMTSWYGSRAVAGLRYLAQLRMSGSGALS
jgi:ABC-type Fe3+-hydroxamate transport system substrate-binding protein